jgi:hypothetical protein
MAQVVTLEGEANKKLAAVKKTSSLAGNNADEAKRLSDQPAYQVGCQAQLSSRGTTLLWCLLSDSQVPHPRKWNLQ